MSDFWSSLFQGPVTTQTSSAGSFAQPFWNNYLQGAVNQATNTNFTPYGGPTVAPQNFMQGTANDMMYNLATGGSPAGNMANSAIVAQASGANLANPYATTLNPYMGAQNPYEGNNPALQAMVQGVNNDMTRAYSQGTAAQTDSAFNRSGAFGGSAYQQAVANNQNDLARQLGNVDANIYGQNYYNSGQLANQDLARNSQMGEDALNRASGAYQNALGQQLGAASLGLQSQGVDMNAINNLAGLGYGQQQNTQAGLNAAQNYYTQSQMAPFMGLDIIGGALNNYSNSNRYNTTQLPGASPLATGIGAIGAGYQLFGPNGIWPLFGGSGGSIANGTPNGTGYIPMAPFNPQPLP